MDPSGECMLFSTTSKALIEQLEQRESRGEIPFRTTVTAKPSKNNPSMSYYTFT